MEFLFRVFLLICVASKINGDTVCYEGLDCFNNTYPWFSLLRPFPMPKSPEEVNTTFYFSTRGVNNSFIPTWPQILMHQQFDAQKPTYFVTHGYSSDINTDWFYNLTNAIITKTNSNVFAVDWSKGASGSYFSASANTRIVAAEIVRVIHYLETNNSLNLTAVHLFGHSLGSHIMAYVGKKMTNPSVHRITALDPAQPGFQGKNPLVRLDKTDATFIDVIHTDGKPFLPFLGLGMTVGVGDVDFFVNGGKWQPNCVMDATCSHSRAPRYMAAAIKESCSMWAFRYNTESASLRWKNFLDNDECNRDSCTIMGLNTTQYPARGNFAFETTGSYPFCKVDTLSNITKNTI